MAPGLQMQLWHELPTLAVHDGSSYVQVGSSHLSDRTFPSTLPSSKAKRLSPALGLQCTISFRSVQDTVPDL